MAQSVGAPALPAIASRNHHQVQALRTMSRIGAEGACLLFLLRAMTAQQGSPLFFVLILENGQTSCFCARILGFPCHCSRRLPTIQQLCIAYCTIRSVRQHSVLVCIRVTSTSTEILRSSQAPFPTPAGRHSCIISSATILHYPRTTSSCQSLPQSQPASPQTYLDTTLPPSCPLPVPMASHVVAVGFMPYEQPR